MINFAHKIQQQIWQRKNISPRPVSRSSKRRPTTTIYATAPFVRCVSTACAASSPATHLRTASSCIPSTSTIHNCRVLTVPSTVTTNRYACPAAYPPSTTTCQVASSEALSITSSPSIPANVTTNTITVPVP